MYGCMYGVCVSVCVCVCVRACVCMELSADKRLVVGWLGGNQQAPREERNVWMAGLEGG